MSAEFEFARTCPECSGDYVSTYYRNIDGFLYKIYVHDDESECRSIVCDIYVKEKYEKKVYVDFQYVDHYVDNILRAFCSDVEVTDLKGVGDIFFPEIDLVVEIKTIKDLDDSIRDDRAIGEILQATDNDDPKKNHEHYIFNVIGSTIVYASTIDDYSTEDFLTRVKKIEGFLASIAARFKIENTRQFENVFTMCVFTVSYAKWLEETKKKPKMLFIEKIKIPRGEERTASMLRAGVPGVETELAVRIAKKVKSVANIVRDNKILDGINGIGPVKKKNVIDSLEGVNVDSKKMTREKFVIE